MNISVGQIFATAIVLLFLAFNFPGMIRFFREFAFYRSAGWDLKQDSGIEFLGRIGMAERFSFLPIGIVRLLVGLSQTLMFCMPFIAMLNGHFLKD